MCLPAYRQPQQGQSRRHVQPRMLVLPTEQDQASQAEAELLAAQERSAEGCRVANERVGV